MTTISIRVETSLADEAKKIYGVRSRAEAVRLAVQEFVRSPRPKASEKKSGSKPSFARSAK
jgi:metal-responsive CopG/Arc/MetJ family transcriptional regulator